MNGIINQILDANLEQMASVFTVLTYLGFVYATIGLANSSRNRWEDLTMASAGAPTTVQEKASNQASTDFHNWYGSIIFISNIGEVLALVALVWLLRTGAWTQSVWLAGIILALAFGHIFCSQTYRKEAHEILGEPKTYRAFFPCSFVLAGRP